MLCIDTPAIVAKQSWLGQLGNLASTTLFTPSAAGVFRISAYIECGNVTATAFVQYTDDYVTISPVSMGNCNGNVFNNGTQPDAFRVAAGGAVKVSATATNSTFPYDLYVVLEQLW